MSYYSKCLGCGKQHHASFPYCEHCGGYVMLNLSDVVMVNKEFRPTKHAPNAPKRGAKKVASKTKSKSGLARR